VKVIKHIANDPFNLASKIRMETRLPAPSPNLPAPPILRGHSRNTRRTALLLLFMLFLMALVSYHQATAQEHQRHQTQQSKSKSTTNSNTDDGQEAGTNTGTDKNYYHYAKERIVQDDLEAEEAAHSRSQAKHPFIRTTVEHDQDQRQTSKGNLDPANTIEMRGDYYVVRIELESGTDKLDIEDTRVNIMLDGRVTNQVRLLDVSVEESAIRVLIHKDLLTSFRAAVRRRVDISITKGAKEALDSAREYSSRRSSSSSSSVHGQQLHDEDGTDRNVHANFQTTPQVNNNSPVRISLPLSALVPMEAYADYRVFMSRGGVERVSRRHASRQDDAGEHDDRGPRIYSRSYIPSADESSAWQPKYAEAMEEMGRHDDFVSSKRYRHMQESLESVSKKSSKEDTKESGVFQSQDGMSDPRLQSEEPTSSISENQDSATSLPKDDESAASSPISDDDIISVHEDAPPKETPPSEASEDEASSKLSEPVITSTALDEPPVDVEAIVEAALIEDSVEIAVKHLVNKTSYHVTKAAVEVLESVASDLVPYLENTHYRNSLAEIFGANLQGPPKLLKSAYASSRAIAAMAWFYLVGLDYPKSQSVLGISDTPMFSFSMEKLIPQNMTRARDLFEVGAYLGDPDAQAMLATLVSSGIVRFASESEHGGSDPLDANSLSLLLWTLAANAGSPYAQMALGYRYLHGIGVAKSCDVAAMLYERAASRVVGDELVYNMYDQDDSYDILEDGKADLGFLDGGSMFSRRGANDAYVNGEKSMLSGLKSMRERGRLLAPASWKQSRSAQVVMSQAYGANAKVEPSSPAMEMGQQHVLLDRIRLQENMNFRRKGHEDEIIQYYIHNARKGDVTAQVIVGQLYLLGLHGLKRDELEARRLFEHAANEGYDPRAHANLGFMYAYGLGNLVASNETAYYHYEKAAHQNDPVGLNGLGWCYMYGIGVEPDPEEAFKYFSKAAEYGYPEAMYNVGVLQLKGVGTSKSIEFAFNSFASAARRGHLKAMYQTGIMLRQEVFQVVPSNCALSVKMLKQVAEYDFSLSDLLVSAIDLYEQQDYSSSLIRYIIAAHAGIEVAQHNAAYMLENGYGAEIFAKADEDLDDTTKRVSEHGDAEHSSIALASQESLTSAFPIASHIYQAQAFYEMSAIQGAKDSALHVGDIAYEQQNYVRAARAYNNAGNHQISEAFFNLGMMHARGKGYMSDLHASQRLFDRALKQVLTSQGIALPKSKDASTTPSEYISLSSLDLHSLTSEAFPIVLVLYVLPVYFKYKSMLDPVMDGIEWVFSKYREGSALDRFVYLLVHLLSIESSNPSPLSMPLSSSKEALPRFVVSAPSIMSWWFQYYDLVIVLVLALVLAGIVIYRHWAWLQFQRIQGDHMMQHHEQDREPVEVLE